MKWHSRLGFVLLLGVVIMASAKHPSIQKKDPPESWVDPTTGLMWAGKDNGRDINWRKATKYCRDLRLGGYADWRLGTIEELRGIHDSTARSPGAGGRHGETPLVFQVKGNLFLTGDPWSSTQRLDERGRPLGFAWFFDFINPLRERADPDDHVTGKRALCVRRSE